MSFISKKWLPRLFIAAIWLFAGTLYSLQSYFYRAQINSNVAVLPLVIRDFSNFIIWGLFGPLIFWLARRFPFNRNKWLKFGFLHLAWGIIIAVAHRSLYTLVIWQTGSKSDQPVAAEEFFLTVFAYFDYSLVLYFATLFCYTGFTYYQQYLAEQANNANLSAALTKARLQALQAQLHPHSLFNTLNAINTLILDDPLKAIQMVEKLSDLLRYTLQRDNQQIVTLAEAMHYVNLYLSIQETRFGDRLQILREVPEDLLNAAVPALLLQPIIENAVQHGISEQLETGVLRISIRREQNRLLLSVEDNGPGLSSESWQSSNQGIGLSNTRARLEKLYGNQAELILTSDKGVKVEIAIPFEVYDDQDHHR